MCHPYLDWCHWLRIFFLSFLSFEGTPFEHGYSLRSNLCSQFVVVRQSGDTCMEIPLSVNSYFSLGFRTFFMLSFIWGRLHGSIFCLNDSSFSFPCRCTRVHCTEVFGWGEGIFAVLFNSELFFKFFFLILDIVTEECV